MGETIRKSTFEKDFIERTYSSIISDATTAFSELVANSWDAGATAVHITLPEDNQENIVIEDNGSGMTDGEFQTRWMVIAYNRVAHQGPYIECESSRGKIRRVAYGRNGVGRHSMLCFNDQYEIETWKNGVCNQYLINVDGGDSAFSVIEHKTFPKEGHGTKLSVQAIKKVPRPKEIVRTLGYRFLFDPEFAVYVNDQKIEFQRNLKPLHSEELTQENAEAKLKNLHGILVAPGFGHRGINGKLLAIEYARTHNIPFFGICLGMQMAVIEFARNVLHLEGADSTEMAAKTPYPVIDLMESQHDVTEKGGTMRLGAYNCELKEGSKAFEAYGQKFIRERHRHRYEFNNKYKDKFEQAGMVTTGVNPETGLTEIIEIPKLKWFVGVQFHPEYKSTVTKPHPLFIAFIKACLS